MKKTLFCFLFAVMIFSAFAEQIYVTVGNYAPILEREKKGELTKSDTKSRLMMAKLEQRFAQQLTEKAKMYGFELIETGGKPAKLPCLSANIDAYNCLAELYVSKGEPLISMKCNDGARYTFSFAESFDSEKNTKILKSIIFNTELVLAKYYYFIQNKQNTPIAQSAPHFVDSFVPRNYLSKELPSSPQPRVQSIAARNDYSFVVCDNTCIRFFDEAGTITACASDQMAQEDRTAANDASWCASCVDGEHIRLGSSNSSSVYQFNASNALQKKEKYYFPPNSTQLFFTADGTPCVYTNKNDFCILNNDVLTKDTVKNTRKNSFKIQNGEIYQKEFQQDYLLVTDVSGNRIKIIYLPDSENLNTLALLTKDSSIILSGSENGETVFACYSANGILQWKLHGEPELEDAELHDYANGMYYFAGNNGKVIRYFDAAAAVPEYLKKISAYNAKLDNDRWENSSLYLSISAEYYKHGGAFMAYEALKNYLRYNPADSKTADKKIGIELELKKKSLQEKVQYIHTLYEEVGKYAAKAEFYKVIAEIETLLQQHPDDAELQREYDELVSLFDSSAGTAANTKASASEIQLKSIELSVLFPALINVYAANPSGCMTIQNISGKDVSDVSVSCFLKNYMDFASESEPVRHLAAGQTATIELHTLLNSSAMKVIENTNLQMRFTLKWKSDNTEKVMEIVRPVVMYRKSSMLWTDSAMLSCFIMPNDPTTAQFAYTSLAQHTEKESLLSRNFINALYLVNALGSTNLHYVPDPVTPVSSVMNKQFAVDTVKYPAETLTMHGGDCDDTTVLFCSVLESVGIPCAVITIPGHVLAAFDVGFSDNAIWQEAAKQRMFIEKDGRLWIPIETTVMNSGFMTAWEKATEMLKLHAAEEFIIVAEQRENYPPVMNDTEAADIRAASSTVAQSRKDSMAAKSFVASVLREFESTIDAKKLNSAAKVYYLIGDTAKAVSVLQRCIEHNASYEPARKNLAVLTNTERTQPEKSGVYVSEGNNQTLASTQRAANAEDFVEWAE